MVSTSKLSVRTNSFQITLSLPTVAQTITATASRCVLARCPRVTGLPLATLPRVKRIIYASHRAFFKIRGATINLHRPLTRNAFRKLIMIHASALIIAARAWTASLVLRSTLTRSTQPEVTASTKQSHLPWSRASQTSAKATLCHLRKMGKINLSDPVPVARATSPSRVPTLNALMLI